MQISVKLLVLSMALLPLVFCAEKSTENAEATTSKPVLRMQRRPDQRLPVRTEYFDPTTYTSRDFPRLIEGLGQQITRDVERAHAEMVENAEKVRAMQNRVDRLERVFMSRADDERTYTKYLTILAIGLLIGLSVLLCANMMLIRQLMDSKRNKKRMGMGKQEHEAFVGMAREMETV